jgi:hypothetical protein
MRAALVPIRMTASTVWRETRIILVRRQLAIRRVALHTHQLASVVARIGAGYMSELMRYPCRRVVASHAVLAGNKMLQGFTCCLRPIVAT